MPEQLHLTTTLDLEHVAAGAPGILLGVVEQMFQSAEEAAVDAGRRLDPNSFELTGGVVDANPMTDVPAHLMLKLTCTGHLIEVTEESVLARRWYAVPDILGWALATADINAAIFDESEGDERVVAEVRGERTARHLANLHNAWLTNERGLDVNFMRRLIAFSQDAFGPNERTGGLLDHLRKELDEVADDPYDLDEWADVVLLGLDGAWRHGGQPQEVLDRVVAKLARNESRSWPDWRDLPEDRAIEHDRPSDLRLGPPWEGES